MGRESPTETLKLGWPIGLQDDSLVGRAPSVKPSSLPIRWRRVRIYLHTRRRRQQPEQRVQHCPARADGPWRANGFDPVREHMIVLVPRQDESQPDVGIAQHQGLDASPSPALAATRSGVSSSLGFAGCPNCTSGNRTQWRTSRLHFGAPDSPSLSSSVTTSSSFAFSSTARNLISRMSSSGRCRVVFVLGLCRNSGFAATVSDVARS